MKLKLRTLKQCFLLFKLRANKSKYESTVGWVCNDCWSATFHHFKDETKTFPRERGSGGDEGVGSKHLPRHCLDVQHDAGRNEKEDRHKTGRLLQLRGDPFITQECPFRMLLSLARLPGTCMTSLVRLPTRLTS